MGARGKDEDDDLSSKGKHRTKSCWENQNRFATVLPIQSTTKQGYNGHASTVSAHGSAGWHPVSGGWALFITFSGETNVFASVSKCVHQQWLWYRLLGHFVATSGFFPVRVVALYEGGSNLQKHHEDGDHCVWRTRMNNDTSQGCISIRKHDLP